MSERAELYDPVKCTRTGVGEVEKKFGVPPSMCNDVIALMGDAADGIPGAVGIGVKTAAKMMQQFGGLETMLERVGEVRGKKTQQVRFPSACVSVFFWTRLEYRNRTAKPFFWSFSASASVQETPSFSPRMCCFMQTLPSYVPLTLRALPYLGSLCSTPAGTLR